VTEGSRQLISDDERKANLPSLFRHPVARALVALALICAAVVIGLQLVNDDGKPASHPSTSTTVPGSYITNPSALVTVPSVVGLSAAEASAKLTSAGLQPKLPPSQQSAANAKVVSQVPAPTARVAKGSFVTLAVAP
jgi:hypothetical protein